MSLYSHHAMQFSPDNNIANKILVNGPPTPPLTRNLLHAREVDCNLRLGKGFA